MLATLMALAAQAATVPPAVRAAPSAVAPAVAQAATPLQVVASAPLDDGSGSTIDLLIGGDRAMLRARGGRYDAGRVAIDTVDLALVLLADRRMAPLWPALADWAGPDLEKLRDRRLAMVRAEVADGATGVAHDITSSTVRPAVRAAMLLGEAQVTAGQVAAGTATIAAARDAIVVGNDWSQAEYMALTLRLSTYRRYEGGLVAQLATLEEGERQLGPASPYTINFLINRAALLVEAGRAEEGLSLLDRAQAGFSGKLKGGGSRVPGSGREFAWIRICALSKLGRAAEAAPIMASVYPATEPRDRAFVLTNSETIRLRLFRCTGDTAAFARELARQLATQPIGGGAFLMAQPNYRTPTIDPAFRRRVADEPELKRALADRLRILPPALTPALVSWMPPPAAR